MAIILSANAKAWFHGLSPKTTNDEHLIEWILLKKIRNWLKPKAADQFPEQGNIAYSYLIEVANQSLAISQLIEEAANEPLNLLENEDESVKAFSKKEQFHTLLLDNPNFFKVDDSRNKDAQNVAHNWLKNLTFPPLGEFSSWSWSDRNVPIAQRIVNKKIDQLILGKESKAIKEEVAKIVEQAKHHPRILDALLRDPGFFDKKHIAKQLTAEQWFELLIAYKDNKTYNKAICKVLLQPQNYIFNRNTSSLAHQQLDSGKIGIIKAAEGGNNKDLDAIVADRAKPDPEVAALQKQVAQQQKEIDALKQQQAEQLRIAQEQQEKIDAENLQRKKAEQKRRTKDEKMVTSALQQMQQMQLTIAFLASQVASMQTGQQQDPNTSFGNYFPDEDDSVLNENHVRRDSEEEEEEERLQEQDLEGFFDNDGNVLEEEKQDITLTNKTLTTRSNGYSNNILHKPFTHVLQADYRLLANLYRAQVQKLPKDDADPRLALVVAGGQAPKF